MKKTLIAVSLVATSMFAHAQTTEDLMNTKLYELTYEQKKDLYSKLSDEQHNAVDAFYNTQQYRLKMYNINIENLSINQIIKTIEQENNKKDVVKVKN